MRSLARRAVIVLACVQMKIGYVPFISMILGLVPPMLIVRYLSSESKSSGIELISLLFIWIGCCGLFWSTLAIFTHEGDSFRKQFYSEANNEDVVDIGDFDVDELWGKIQSEKAKRDR